ncbi:MAG: Periplasmic copper-binding protein (NosD) [Methanosaeta sp. PtaU1.Bin028]|nr:MAG: Periplasmic copper-binding protein (NosD) [Methanosaeta sp. PtaU1.Bin028]
MSMTWPWYSQECAISGIDGNGMRASRAAAAIAVLAMLFFSMPASSAATIQAGADLAGAIAASSPGDTIRVGPGEQRPFVVDRPLTILADGASVKADLQQPAIFIRSGNVRISGFSIQGVPKDSQSKFSFYMERLDGGRTSAPTVPQYGSGASQGGILRLNLTNAGIVLQGVGIALDNLTISGAEEGVLAENSQDLQISNCSFLDNDRGLHIKGSAAVAITGNRFSGSSKDGLTAEFSRQITLKDNSALDNKNAGLFLKNCSLILAEGNLVSDNTFGLALWNCTDGEVRRNRAHHSYYGILLANTINTTVLDNLATENARSEIVAGFGIGISLTENSSRNLILRNSASKNFNGLELIKGCRYNVVFGNNLTQNTHGIRAAENHNNLIFGNNFEGNVISIYEDDAHNFWNASAGNYYSDYAGPDGNGDGRGDLPYLIPKGNTNSADLAPLMEPDFNPLINTTYLWAELARYATYDATSEGLPVIREGKGVMIQAPRPKGPPVFSDDPMALERPAFTPDI